MTRPATEPAPGRTRLPWTTIALSLTAVAADLTGLKYVVDNVDAQPGRKDLITLLVVVAAACVTIAAAAVRFGGRPMAAHLAPRPTPRPVPRPTPPKALPTRGTPMQAIAGRQRAVAAIETGRRAPNA